MAFHKKKKKDSPLEIQSIITEKEKAGSVYTMRIDRSTDALRVGLSSNLGNRACQQDAARVSDDYYYMDTQRAMAVLCDGMGGLSGGERASQLGVNALYELFIQNRHISETEIQSFYATALPRLDMMVHALKKENGDPLGAGTTLISVMICESKLYWASVGDSHIYFIRDGKITCITQDHNYYKILCERVRKGEISQEEADADPKKEALLSYLGIGGMDYMDISAKPIQLQAGDTVLLCSDGLYRSLTQREMIDIVQCMGKDMQTAASRLTEAAIQKGKRHQDNTTAVLLQYI